MSRAKKPNKKELARMKALSDLGVTPTSIAKRLKRSHHTVIKYLRQYEIFEDPEVIKLIDLVKEREIDDLYLLGTKARQRLHEILDEGNTKAIETTAVMDRSFQQRRLLEGASTQNISLFDHIIEHSARDWNREGEKPVKLPEEEKKEEE